MRCEDISEELAAFMLGELSKDESDAIRTHLDSCERCSTEVAQYRQTLLALSRWKMPAHGRPPSFAFLPAPPLSTANAMPRESRFRRVARAVIGTAIAAAVAAAFLFGTHVQYKEGTLSINVGRVGTRYSPADSAKIAAIVDNVRQQDMQLISDMITASEVRQAELYRARFESFSRQINDQQRGYVAYLMDHIYRLQQQNQVAYYQSSAALNGVVKLVSSVR